MKLQIPTKASPETRMIALPVGENRMIVASFVSEDVRTDRQTRSWLIQQAMPTAVKINNRVPQYTLVLTVESITEMFFVLHSIFSNDNCQCSDANHFSLLYAHMWCIMILMSHVITDKLLLS